MNINPVAYKLEPIHIDNDNFMKARIRQEPDFVNKAILRSMTNDINFLRALLQNMDIKKDEDYYMDSQVFIPTLYIVPAMQVIAEQQRIQTPRYNGERIINRTGRF